MNQMIGTQLPIPIPFVDLLLAGGFEAARRYGFARPNT
jgi:hypothetical protein